MPKDCIPIREVRVGETACKSLNINDYSYRSAGQRFAEQYVENNWNEEKLDGWVLNLGWFFLGAFVWEFIPVFTNFGFFIYNYILTFL